MRTPNSFLHNIWEIYFTLSIVMETPGCFADYTGNLFLSFGGAKVKGKIVFRSIYGR